MSAKDKTLATFQIDKTKWSKFKRLTGNQSASAVLVQFIEKFLDNPYILEQSNYDETSNIEHQSITDSRIKELEERLEIIETYNEESAINPEANYITNLELTEVSDRLKTLEDKFSVIEKSNTESVINSATESISNLEDRYKELKDKLSIIESSNKQSVTNSDRESISNLEGERPSAITENINKEEQEKKEISKEEEKATKPETEKPKEEIPEKVRSLSTGTELTGKKLAELIGVDPSYISKYKSEKMNPPTWFWDNFESIGKGNKSKWVKR